MKTEIKWGVIIAIAGFLWVCLEYAVGLHTRFIDLHPYLTMLWIPIAIYLLVLALREKRAKDYGGRMSYMQGFMSSVIIAVVLVLLSPITMYIFFNFINPGFFDTMVAHAVESGQERSTVEAYFNFSSYMWQGVISGVIGTIATGAIAMAFMRSKD